MKKYWFVSLFLVLAFMVNSVFAGTIVVRAAAEKYRRKNVGSVYINDQVVIRVYDRGAFQSPYKRAKEIVRRITDLANKGKQLSSIKVMKGTTATVGIADNREIFRIYEDDVLENNSTPISLATAWIENVQNAIKNLPVDNSIPYKPKTNIEVSRQKKAPVAKPQKTAKAAPKIQAEPEPVTRIAKKIEAPVLRETVSKPVMKKAQPLPKEKKDIAAKETVPKKPILQPKPMIERDSQEKTGDKLLFTNPIYNNLLIGMFIGMFLIIIFLGVLIFLQFKKVKMSKNGIVSQASTDELENLVSHLIGELETRSADITTDFQQKVSHLESLMMTVDTKATEIEQIINKPPVVEPTIPETPVVEPMPSATPVTPHIEPQSRTKQEIIYEMADQGTSVTDIAKKLGIGTGEVQLILDLKQ